MSTEVSLVNAQVTLKDRITEKLRTDFINLLSNEELGAIYDTAMDEFLHGPRSKRFKKIPEWTPNGYKDQEVPIEDFDVFKCEGTLPNMILKEITLLANATLKTALENGPLKAEWDSDAMSFVYKNLEELIATQGGT